MVSVAYDASASLVHVGRRFGRQWLKLALKADLRSRYFGKCAALWRRRWRNIQKPVDAQLRG
eukprot:2914584-Lingulodinium_polyedra.AAC.1